jgi:hypothetical protein
MAEPEVGKFPWDADLKDFHEGSTSGSNNSFSPSLLNPGNWKRGPVKFVTTTHGGCLRVNLALAAFTLIAISGRKVTSEKLSGGASRRLSGRGSPNRLVPLLRRGSCRRRRDLRLALDIHDVA